MSFDDESPFFYYRLTNAFTGQNLALEATTTTSTRGNLRMAPIADNRGQRWRLTEFQPDRYVITSAFLGTCFAIEVDVKPPLEGTAILAKAEDVPRQHWSLIPWGDGTYRLRNAHAGPSKGLDLYNDTHELYLAEGNTSGQHWTLTRIEPMAINKVPPLHPNEGVNLSEGPTDFNYFVNPNGVVRAVMVFIDFPNVPATETPRAVADHLLGIEKGQSTGKAQQLFADQSYGKMTLDVKVEEEWKRMPDASDSFYYKTYPESVITDALKQFPPDQYNLHTYDMVFLVTPRGGGLPLSPAYSSAKGSGTKYGPGEVRMVVTFGNDSYTNRYTNLVHEVGHLFGLPDLYLRSSSIQETWKMGCWSIMSDIFHCVSFIGWHRQKNGWLDRSRKEYLPAYDGTWKRERNLSPLSGDCGLSMIVLPIDDPIKPPKVYVIEQAEPVLGPNGQTWGEGVLLYTVDANVSSGESPLVLIPKKTSTSPDYGHLYEAPYVVGDVAKHKDGNASLRVEVLQKFHALYRIGIELTRT